jgi:FkbM family methyltransferase
MKGGADMQADPQTSEARWHYLRSALGMSQVPTIVDVGANPLDDAPYKALLAAGLCRVYGFEPQADAFTRLQDTRGPLETYSNCALADGAEHVLHVYRGSGLTSLFRLDPRSVGFLGRAKRAAHLEKTLPVQTRRLDDIDGITRMDLLKIDVQGAEKMIFEHGATRLSEAVAVITELRMYPLYENEPMMDEEIGVLSSFGFRFHKYQFVKNQMIENSQKMRLRPRRIASQALDGDGVFIRDLRDPAALSNGQIQALAMLADAVFESYDLTLHCLDLLVARQAVAEDVPKAYADLLPAELRRD